MKKRINLFVIEEVNKMKITWKDYVLSSILCICLLLDDEVLVVGGAIVGLCILIVSLLFLCNLVSSFVLQKVRCPDYVVRMLKAVSFNTFPCTNFKFTAKWFIVLFLWAAFAVTYPLFVGVFRQTILVDLLHMSY